MATTDDLYVYRVRPVRVIDGDTIDGEIDVGFLLKMQERIRFYDVDTPEIRGSRADPRGYTAKYWAEAWFKGTEKKIDLSHPELWQPQYNQYVEHTMREAYLQDIVMISKIFNPRDHFGRVLGLFYRPGDPESLSEALVRVGLTAA